MGSGGSGVGMGGSGRGPGGGAGSGQEVPAREVSVRGGVGSGTGGVVIPHLVTCGAAGHPWHRLSGGGRPEVSRAAQGAARKYRNVR